MNLDICVILINKNIKWFSVIILIQSFMFMSWLFSEMINLKHLCLIQAGFMPVHIWIMCFIFQVAPLSNWHIYIPPLFP